MAGGAERRERGVGELAAAAQVQMLKILGADEGNEAHEAPVGEAQRSAGGRNDGWVGSGAAAETQLPSPGDTGVTASHGIAPRAADAGGCEQRGDVAAEALEYHRRVSRGELVHIHLQKYTEINRGFLH